MAIAALIVAVLALVVSTVSVAYTHRLTHATETQAEAARRQDLRARTPIITMRLAEPVSQPDTSALFYVKNNGAEDLDVGTIHRPSVDGGVIYGVAPLGAAFGDAVDLCPLQMGDEKAFVLSIGSREELPELMFESSANVAATRGRAPSRWMIHDFTSASIDPSR